MNETKIIEVNGVKLELDMRTGKTTQIDTYRIGDNVKVLVKEYGDNYKSYPGVIVGFDNFKTKPTIVVAYLKLDYSCAEIQFIYFNSESKEELVLTGDHDIAFEKSRVLELLDRDILKKEEEIKDLQSKKKYFLNNFKKYFK